MLVTLGSAQHQRLQPGVENVGRDGVHELHLEKLRRLDLVHAQPPAIDLAQINLLPVLVVTIRGEQRLAVAKVLIQIAPLRERRAVQEPLAVPPRRRRDERARCRARRSLQRAPQLVVARERTPPGRGSASSDSASLARRC